MSETYKVLAQLNPSATTLTLLFTVPAATSVVVSKLTVCNQGIAGSFRVSVSVAGAADNAKQYIDYDVPIAVGESIDVAQGVTLSTTDLMRVYASHANMSFNLFGDEIA